MITLNLLNLATYSLRENKKTDQYSSERKVLCLFAVGCPVDLDVS